MMFDTKEKAIEYAKDHYDNGHGYNMVVIESRGEFHAEAGDGGFVRSWERIIWRNGKAVDE